MPVYASRLVVGYEITDVVNNLLVAHENLKLSEGHENHHLWPRWLVLRMLHQHSSMTSARMYSFIQAEVNTRLKLFLPIGARARVEFFSSSVQHTCGDPLEFRTFVCLNESTSEMTARNVSELLSAAADFNLDRKVSQVMGVDLKAKIYSVSHIPFDSTCDT